MKNIIHGCLQITLLIICTTLSLHAHPGGHGHGASRIWTLTDGSTIQGSFLHAKENQVHVEQADGTIFKIELDRFSEADRQFVAQRQASIERVNKFFQSLQFVAQKGPSLLSKPLPLPNPRAADARTLQAFEKTLQLRWDDDFFYVGSNGMPDHPMMVGIRAWQQQVPMPQKYFGDNAWRIPLHPVPAKEPQTAKGNFYAARSRSVNGVPIFKPTQQPWRRCLLGGN